MQIIMIHSTRLNAFNDRDSMILIEQVVQHRNTKTHTHEVNYVSLCNSENIFVCLFLFVEWATRHLEQPSVVCDGCIVCCNRYNSGPSNFSRQRLYRTQTCVQWKVIFTNAWYQSQGYLALSYTTALPCPVLFCTVLHCPALYCATLQCNAMHCTAMRCDAMQNGLGSWTITKPTHWQYFWYSRVMMPDRVRARARTGCTLYAELSDGQLYGYLSADMHWCALCTASSQLGSIFTRITRRSDSASLRSMSCWDIYSSRLFLW